MTFHAITKNQQDDTAFSLTLVGTESELKIIGVEGAKGDKGDAGADGAKGDKGDPGNDGTVEDAVPRVSTITPSKSAQSFTSEVALDLTAGDLDANQGVSVANNRITFAQAGAYYITGGFQVDASGSTDAGGARSQFLVRMKKNGVTDETFEQQQYLRYADASHGGTRQETEIQLSGAIVVSANDYIEFFGQAFSQITLSHSVASSSSQISVISVNAPLDPAFEHTPKRVTALPSASDALDLERVLVTAEYTNPGFSIDPESFATIFLAGFGLGSRGWMRDDAGYGAGRLIHDDPELANVQLISDTRVYVTRNTLTNLARIQVGGVNYALTRVPQSAGTRIGDNTQLTRDVEWYTIAGGLPAGEWDNIRFETTTAGTFVPAEVTVAKGIYERKNSLWQPVQLAEDVVKAEVAPFALIRPPRVAPFFLPSGHWEGTNTAYSAITTKDSNTLYFTD